MRACAERVAPRVECRGWVVDDTGFPKDGQALAGGEAAVLGDAGEDRNCQIGVSVHAVGKRGTLPLGWALYLPEEWCEDRRATGEGEDPRQVVFKTKPELAAELVEEAAGWEIPRAPVLGDAAYGDNTAFRDRCTSRGGVPARGRRETACSRPRRSSSSPSARRGAAGRRASRGPTASPSRGASSPSGCRRGPPDGGLPRRPRGRPSHCRFVFVRVSRQPESERHQPRVAQERLIIEWPAERRRADRLLDLQPARRHRARAARPARPAALEDRARLPTAQGRTRPRPLRRPSR